MCRIIFAVGKFNSDWLIDDMITMASDQNERHEENAHTVFKHADGWGAAYLENGKLQTFHSSASIFNDPQIDQFRGLKTHFLILHARYGTRGEPELKNVHPFEYKTDSCHYAFFHNGTVRDDLNFDEKFKLQGETDSERFFYYLLSNGSKTLTDSKLEEKLKQLEDFSGANFVLTDGQTTHIAEWFSLNPLYYTMKILKQKESLIIASEVLPHYKNQDWEKLENHAVFSVKTSDYVVNFHRKGAEKRLV